MTDFLIKSSLSLIVLIAVYFLILENEKMAIFNRFYLLFSILFSFSLPFITIEVLADTSNAILQETVFKPENVMISVVDDAVNYFEIVFWTLYGIGTVFFLIRFVKNIHNITFRIKRNPIVKYKNAKLVLLEEKTLPHTFLNTIFINKSDYENRNIEDELYTHELTHVAQKHTLDILFIEIIKCFFWFNPILIFYKKAIQLNHEFLADEKVVNSYNNIPVYQSLLLSKANGKQPYYLASNLNYLVTKKRLIMMSKKTPISIAILKKVALTPFFAGLIFFMCVKSVAQEKENINKNKISDSKEIEVISYFDNTTFKITNNEGIVVAEKKFNELTPEEKGKIPPPPPPMPPKPIYSKDEVKKYREQKRPEKVIKIKTIDEPKSETLEDIIKPSFPGGFEMFFKYVGTNFKIPEEFKGKGKIYIKFFVEKDGSLSDIEIIRDLGFGLGDEAVRVLKESPKWIPGQVNGKPVRMMYSLPISIVSKT